MDSKLENSQSTSRKIINNTPRHRLRARRKLSFYKCSRCRKDKKKCLGSETSCNRCSGLGLNCSQRTDARGNLAPNSTALSDTTSPKRQRLGTSSKDSKDRVAVPLLEGESTFTSPSCTSPESEESFHLDNTSDKDLVFSRTTSLPPRSLKRPRSLIQDQEGQTIQANGVQTTFEQSNKNSVMSVRNIINTDSPVDENMSSPEYNFSTAKSDYSDDCGENRALTPLHFAITNDHAEMVACLLEKGGDLLCTTAKNENSIHLAASLLSTKTLNQILSRNTPIITAALSSRDSKGRTPFLVAVDRGTIAGAEALVKAGSLPFVKDYLRLNALHLSAKRDDDGKMLKYILSLNCLRVDSNISPTPLQVAAGSGNLAAVQLLVENNADVNIRTDSLGTPLCCAVRSGNQDVVHWLLKHNANPDIAGPRNETALYLAIQQDHFNISNMLLECGVTTSLHTQTTKGELPIHAAATRGNTDILDLLFSHGSAIDVADAYGRTILHLATEKNHTQAIMSIIKQETIDVNVEDDYERAAISYAITNSNEQICELFLSQGAKISNYTENVLELAVNQGAVRIVQLLLEHGASSPFNENKTTLLHLAAKKGHIEIAKMLIEAGADPNEQMDHGDSGASTEIRLSSNTFPMDMTPVRKPKRRHTTPSSSQISSLSKNRQSLRCNFCGAMIRMPRMNLTRHIRTLHQEKPRFACSWEGCEVTTSRFDNFKMHLRRHEEKKEKETEKAKLREENARVKGEKMRCLELIPHKDEA